MRVLNCRTTGVSVNELSLITSGLLGFRDTLHRQNRFKQKKIYELLLWQKKDSETACYFDHELSLSRNVLLVHLLTVDKKYCTITLQGVPNPINMCVCCIWSMSNITIIMRNSPHNLRVSETETRHILWTLHNTSFSFFFNVSLIKYSHASMARIITMWVNIL